MGEFRAVAERVRPLPGAITVRRRVDPQLNTPFKVGDLVMTQATGTVEQMTSAQPNPVLGVAISSPRKDCTIQAGDVIDVLIYGPVVIGNVLAAGAISDVLYVAEQGYFTNENSGDFRHIVGYGADADTIIFRPDFRVIDNSG